VKLDELSHLHGAFVIGRGGREHPSDSSGNRGVLQDPAAKSAAIPREVAVLAEKWRLLPEGIRSGILAMVSAVISVPR